MGSRTRKPEHTGKLPREDFLAQHFPDLKTPKNELPKFNPVGQIGVEELLLPKVPAHLFGHEYRNGRPGTTVFLQQDPGN